MTVDLDLHHVRIQSGMCAFYHGLVHLKMALTIFDGRYGGATVRRLTEGKQGSDFPSLIKRI